MAEQHGGKRTPRNPAPVSGPGKLSRRTDGGPAQVNAQMTGMDYGENKDFMEVQEGAAMASSAPQVNPMGLGGSVNGGAKGTSPMFAPTGRPDEPVTAGADFGPGDGAPVTPTMSQINKDDTAMVAKYLPSLLRQAEDPDAPDGFKRFVRHLRNKTGGPQ